MFPRPTGLSKVAFTPSPAPLRAAWPKPSFVSTFREDPTRQAPFRMETVTQDLMNHQEAPIVLSNTCVSQLLTAGVKESGWNQQGELPAWQALKSEFHCSSEMFLRFPSVAFCLVSPDSPSARPPGRCPGSWSHRLAAPPGSLKPKGLSKILTS